MKSKLSLLTTTAIVSMLAAFDNQPGWKKDEAGNVVLKDGNPVYVTSSGQEQTVNGNTIADRNKEAQTARERAETAEGKLKAFEGIDPEKARSAIELVGKIDSKTLIDAGKVDEVKAQMKGQFETELGELKKQLTDKDGTINNMLISSVFKDSEFLRDGLAVPRDFVESAYRGNFKIEDGKVVAVDKEGKIIVSKENYGEPASPDEALRMFVEARPDKDAIMKANLGNGSGSNGGGGARGKGSVVKRAEFDKMTPAQQGEIAGKARAGEMQIVD